MDPGQSNSSQQNQPVEIINFSDDLKDCIKTLNYEWLERYFRVETSDAISLANPREQIIDKGGFIFYAKLGDEIVGTASLLNKGHAVFEIGKMAVTDSAQGHGIGALLLKHCLLVARQQGVKKLILYSNTKLKPAIQLYTKYGFVETRLEQGLYERANIKMEKCM